jgi:coenzyme Q-binding protein COQ10
MFELVADVESYPAFVPLCQAHLIMAREKGAETETLMTEMSVVYKVCRETFTSRVTLNRGLGRIVVESRNGPLRRLQTHWTFHPHGTDACDVEFYLSYELTSNVLTLLIGTVFDAAFSRFVEAFARRADAVYGRHRPSQHERWSSQLKSKTRANHFVS